MTGTDTGTSAIFRLPISLRPAAGDRQQEICIPR